MPVEIRELLIRAVVHPDAHAPAAGSDARPAAVQPDAEAVDAIVDACVRQVLKILKQAEER